MYHLNILLGTVDDGYSEQTGNHHFHSIFSESYFLELAFDHKQEATRLHAHMQP